MAVSWLPSVYLGLPYIEFTTCFHKFSEYKTTNIFTKISQLKNKTHFLLAERVIFPLSFHNGENDSHKRQFLALRVCSRSWKLNNLSKKNSCQIDWCYKLLATIWQNFFLLSNVNCKVSYLKNKIADKRGLLALISKCQFDSGNII